MNDGTQSLHAIPRRLIRAILVTLLMAAICIASACGRGAVRPTPTSSPVPTSKVVATVALQDPKQALEQYLHGWMRSFNKAALADTVAAQNDSTTTADLVSVVRSASATQTHATFRADFRFTVGLGWSSVHPVWTRHSSATFDLSWDDQGRAWTVTLTSLPPDQALAQ